MMNSYRPHPITEQWWGAGRAQGVVDKEPSTSTVPHSMTKAGCSGVLQFSSQSTWGRARSPLLTNRGQSGTRRPWLPRACA